VAGVFAPVGFHHLLAGLGALAAYPCALGELLILPQLLTGLGAFSAGLLAHSASVSHQRAVALHQSHGELAGCLTIAGELLGILHGLGVGATCLSLAVGMPGGPIADLGALPAMSDALLKNPLVLGVQRPLTQPPTLSLPLRLWLLLICLDLSRLLERRLGVLHLLVGLLGRLRLRLFLAGFLPQSNGHPTQGDETGQRSENQKRFFGALHGRIPLRDGGPRTKNGKAAI
jgi:hypothetical protein